MKKLILFVLLLSGCTPKRDGAIQIFWDQTPIQAQLAAQAQARDIGGMVFHIEPTGSMEPYITGGDYVVSDINSTYASIQQGWLLTYQARWLPPTSPPVMHWTGAKSGNEWIMDGQANAHYEKGEALRMGEKEFTAVNRLGQRIGGRVIAVYTTRKKG